MRCEAGAEKVTALEKVAVLIYFYHRGNSVGTGSAPCAWAGQIFYKIAFKRVCFCEFFRDVRADAACLLAQSLPLVPAKGESFDSLPLGTPSQRPKALPLETGRSSRSSSYSRTGMACA